MIENCENRGHVLDGKKCYCIPWERWTNCLEMGHCTKDSLGGSDDEENDAESEDE